MNAIKGKWTKCFFKRQISREDISLAYEKKKKRSASLITRKYKVKNVHILYLSVGKDEKEWKK